MADCVAELLHRGARRKGLAIWRSSHDLADSLWGSGCERQTTHCRAWLAGQGLAMVSGCIARECSLRPTSVARHWVVLVVCHASLSCGHPGDARSILIHAGRGGSGLQWSWPHDYGPELAPGAGDASRSTSSVVPCMSGITGFPMQGEVLNSVVGAPLSVSWRLTFVGAPFRVSLLGRLGRPASLVQMCACVCGCSFKAGVAWHFGGISGGGRMVCCRALPGLCGAGAGCGDS